MSDIVVDAADALDKLNKLIGGAEFYLDPTEIEFLTTACGFVTIGIQDLVLGPLPEVGFGMVTRYRMIPGTMALTFAVPNLTIAIETDHLTLSGQIKSDFASAIIAGLKAEGYVNASVVTEPLVKYGGTSFAINSGDGTDLTIVGMTWTPNP